MQLKVLQLSVRIKALITIHQTEEITFKKFNFGKKQVPLKTRVLKLFSKKPAQKKFLK